MSTITLGVLYTFQFAFNAYVCGISHSILTFKTTLKKSKRSPSVEIFKSIMISMLIKLKNGDQAEKLWWEQPRNITRWMNYTKGFQWMITQEAYGAKKSIHLEIGCYRTIFLAFNKCLRSNVIWPILIRNETRYLIAIIWSFDF